MGQTLKNVVEKIISKSVSRRNGCLLWIGPVDKWKYGRIYYNGNSHRVHRLVFAEKFGDLTKDDVIRHTCDTPACVNINHLLRGTHVDNVRDRCERKRSAVGSKNGRSKLTEEKVKNILLDERLQRIIAAEYGVDIRVIGRIKRREIWLNLGGL